MPPTGALIPSDVGFKKTSANSTKASEIDWNSTIVAIPTSIFPSNILASSRNIK